MPRVTLSHVYMTRAPEESVHNIVHRKHIIIIIYYIPTYIVTSTRESYRGELSFIDNYSQYIQ